MYFVLSAFTSSPLTLLGTTKVVRFVFTACRVPPSTGCASETGDFATLFFLFRQQNGDSGIPHPVLPNHKNSIAKSPDSLTHPV
jgi:hypothetical protein